MCFPDANNLETYGPFTSFRALCASLLHKITWKLTNHLHHRQAGHAAARSCEAGQANADYHRQACHAAARSREAGQASADITAVEINNSKNNIFSAITALSPL